MAIHTLWLSPTPPEPGKPPQRLQDPLNDRPVKEVPLPPAQLLTAESFYEKNGEPNISALMEHLILEGALSQELLLDIISKASDLFKDEPNLLKLNDPITVVGDVHGQYYDMVKLLEVGGQPGDTQYIFLGDYVDRGSFSVEAKLRGELESRRETWALQVVSVLYSLKIKYPKQVRMLRGNHECRQMTSFFNFREECEYKYDIGVYNAFMDSFDNLPLAATINGKSTAQMHFASSQLDLGMKAITKINRFTEPPKEGLLCNLAQGRPSVKKGGPPFVPNEVRGCSYFYSFDGATTFLKKNNLLSIIRAHEAQLEGYKMHKTNPSTGFPLVITIFSAPNYCDVYNNKGAILKFDNSTLNILQFNCSPHPYHLPNFMDVFQWSMPFVIEKVTEMLYYILQPAAGAAEPEDAAEALPPLPDSNWVNHRARTLRSSKRAAKRTAQRLAKRVKASLTDDQNQTVDMATRLAALISNENAKEREAGGHKVDPEVRDRMRKKVRSIARMARMFKTLRQENETVVRLKGVCPGHKLAPGLLLAGKERLTSELEMFSHAQGIDLVNEKRPEAWHLGISPPGPTDFRDGMSDGEISPATQCAFRACVGVPMFRSLISSEGNLTQPVANSEVTHTSQAFQLQHRVIVRLR
ncbi:unnamed protein product [Effrenium voratum]|nr:unnamed protein product [Effrenium voratum]